MPKPTVEPSAGQVVKKTSVTIDADAWRKSKKIADATGFRHSYSGYLVSLIMRDIQANPDPGHRVDSKTTLDDLTESQVQQTQHKKPADA